MENRKWYCGVIVLLAVTLLVGCGKQGVNQTAEQEVSIRKIMDISGGAVSAESDTATLSPEEEKNGMMIFDELTVEMDFPDEWSVGDSHDEDVDYQSIFGVEYDRSWDFRADEIDKDFINGKIGDSMDAKGASKKLEDYIKEEITGETYYEPTDAYVWQNPAYETVTINGQKYIKASGVTKTKKDAGDAHIGYFTIVNGVILQFVFDTEAATIDQATQSTFDSIMNTITYTY